MRALRSATTGRTARVAAVGLAATAAVGCSLVLTFPDYVGEACQARRWPDKPAASTTGGNTELVGVVRTFSFISSAPKPGRPPALGLDLDGLCTCPEPAACRPPPGRDAPCDVSGTGIDNAAGKLLGALFPSNPVPQDEDAINSLDVTKGGLLIRLQGYNGRPDDADVTVSLYNVVGLVGDDGGASPRFDGNDAFAVDQQQLLAAGSLGSRFNDTAAYVKDNVLVATLDVDLRFVLPESMGPAAGMVAYMPLKSARLVGRIEAAGSGLRMRGAQIAGRMPIPRILEEISRLGLCPGSPAYANAKTAACNSVDLPQDSRRDGTSAACDALSIAVGLEVVPGKLGGSVDAGTPPSPCGDLPPDSCK
jgi:hypothetical protein